MLAKQINFQLEICVKARGGRAPRCMGTPPVAEMLASEARRSRMSGPALAVADTPLYAFSRAIDRESLAGLGNSLKSWTSTKMVGIVPTSLPELSNPSGANKKHWRIYILKVNILKSELPK